MELDTEMKEVLRVLYELSDIATPFDISEQLRLAGYEKKPKVVRGELNKLREMDLVRIVGNNLYEITDKGISYFQT